MRILLDECLPKDLAAQLPGHGVTTVPQAGWASVKTLRDATKLYVRHRAGKITPRRVADFLQACLPFRGW
jgi:hypothetical protein